jgi:hypothetical protein
MQPIQKIYQEINQIQNEIQSGSAQDASIEEKVSHMARRLQNTPEIHDAKLRRELTNLAISLESMGFSKSCQKAYQLYCSIKWRPKSENIDLLQSCETYCDITWLASSIAHLFSTKAPFPSQDCLYKHSIALLDAVQEINSLNIFASTPEHCSTIQKHLLALKDFPKWKEDLNIKVTIIKCMGIAEHFAQVNRTWQDTCDLLKKEQEEFELSSEGLYKTLKELVDTNPKELEELFNSLKFRKAFERRCDMPDASSSEIKALHSLYYYDPSELKQIIASLSEEELLEEKEKIEALKKVESVSGLSGKHLCDLINKIAKSYPELECFLHIISLHNITFNPRLQKSAFTFSFEETQIFEWASKFRGKNVDALWLGVDFHPATLEKEETLLYKMLIKRGTGTAFSFSGITLKGHCYILLDPTSYSFLELIQLLQVHVAEHPLITLEKGIENWTAPGYKRHPEIHKENIFREFPEFSLFFEPEKYQGGAFSLEEKSPFQEMVSSIWNEDLEPHIKETLLTWAGFVEITRKTLPPIQGSEEIERQVLQEIKQIRVPALRYHLTKQLFTTLQSSEQIAFLGSKELEKLTHFKKRALLWKLLLIPLLMKKEFANTLKDFVKLLEKDYFKDAARSYSVMEALCLLLAEDRLSDEAKVHLLAAATLHGDQKVAGSKLISHLMAVKCFLSMYWLSDLRKAKDFSDIAKCLQERFSLITGIDSVDNIQEKYSETFAKFRDPLAIFIYAGSLNKDLGQNDHKEEVLLALKRYVEAVLSGTLREERYEKEPNDHLKQIFASKEGFKEKWINGATYGIDELVEKEPSQNSAFDVKKFLHERIMDGHIAKENVPILHDYLEGKMSVHDAKKVLDSSQPNIYVDLQRALLFLLEENITAKEQTDQFAKHIAPLISQLAEEEFKRDLSALKKLLNPSQRNIPTKGWIVVDTDSAEDIQASGTEVLGSCQNIHGSPTHNKCLLSYLLDGKIRMLAVKNANGKIMARCIIRALWDEKEKSPVLFQERTYQAAGVPLEALKALHKMAEKRANDLGIPLISGGYKNPLTSLNTKAPFEYVDALASQNMNINNGKYTI